MMRLLKIVLLLGVLIYLAVGAGWYFHLRQEVARAERFQQALEAIGQKDYGSAIPMFTSLIEERPDDAAAYYYRSIAYRKQNQFDESIADLNEAMRLKGASAGYLSGRAFASAGKQDFKSALADLDAAIRLDPKSASLLIQRGDVHLEQQRFAAAAADFQLAKRIEPEDPFMLNTLAWLRATCPEGSLRDGTEAVGLATQALAASKQDQEKYQGLSTLAAACAESGDFAAAVKWQQQATKLDVDTPEPPADVKERLAAYERGQPYRSAARIAVPRCTP